MVALELTALETERNEFIARVEAIVELAKSEDRELSEDESTEVDTITDEKVPAIDARIEREKKIVALTTSKLHDRAVERDFSDEPAKKITIPARAKAAGRLKYYEDEKDAFVAGQMYLATIMGNASSAKWCQDHGFTNVMGEGTGTKGGFLVPEEMQRTLVRLREEYGVFPRFARNYPMGTDNLFVPRPLGDATAIWTGENVEITASDVNLGSAELTAKKIACLTRFSSEIDQDSVVDIGEMITNSMAFAMANKIDDAGFNGDGSSSYGGIYGLANALTDADPSAGGAGAVVDATAGNDAADNLDLLDFENVVGAFPAYPNAQPRWFMSKPVYVASWVRLMNALGGVMRSEVSGDQGAEIMGYPVTFANVMTKTTSTNAETALAYFGDLSLTATYGTRRGVRTAVTSDRYFELDQIGVRCDERLAITVHERGDSIEQRSMLMLKSAA